MLRKIVKRVRKKVRKVRELYKEGQIDVLDSTGAPTGATANIYDIHDKGLWHRIANVYVVNSKDEVLAQKRSAGMRVFPNMWQAPMGGHIKSGETSIETALSELKEELGITVHKDDLIPIASTVKDEPQPGGFDREFHDNFVFYSDVLISDLKLQKFEVGGVKWFPIEEYKEILARKDPHHVMHPSLFAFFGYIDSTHGSRKD